MSDARITKYIPGDEVEALLDASAYTGDASERTQIIVDHATALRPRLKKAK